MPFDRRSERCRPMLWRAALLFALMLGSAGSLPAQELASVDVEVVGVDGALERNIRAMLELARAAADGKLPKTRIARLHERADEDIRTALEPFGYYRPSIQKSLTADDDRLTARYVVSPGPVVKVRNVAVELSGPGRNAPEFTRAVEEFPLRSGDSLSHVDYEAGKVLLLTVASDSGYLDAAFDTAVVAVDRDAAVADVTVRFATGERFKFGPVRFEQDILDEDFLRTRIPFEPGDPMRQDQLLELQASLAEDPYFSRVEVSPVREEADGLMVPIRVIMEPRKPAAFEFGAGYGTDTGPRGRVGGEFRRINRKGHHGRAEVVVAAREQSVSGEYSIPAFGHPTGTLTFQAGHARLDPTTSTSNTTTVGVNLLRKRIGWRETLSLGYERSSFGVGVDSGVTNLLIAGGSWERIDSDDRIYPTRGYRATLELKGSRRGVLASESFFSIRAGGKVVRALSPSFRVLSRVEAARVFTDAFRQLPPTIRLFAGGDQSVRGFDYQELGPLDELGHVIGGQSLLTASVEVDYRVVPRWAVAVFADAGNATPSFGLSGLEQGVGAGIRYLAPIGMVRVDAAFGVSRRDPPFRLHLSIGPDL